MYHLELRHFPHNVCRFNLTEPELLAILAPLAAGNVVELGEHRWNPQQVELTVLEGPRIPLGQLSMGRGWRNAQRGGQDVTERMLAAARHAAAASAQPAQPAQPGPPAGDAFALGVQMAALLGPDPMRLLDAWRNAAAGSPGRAPSETLALAEQALRSADAANG
jgi:hypothetical protein